MKKIAIFSIVILLWASTAFSATQKVMIFNFKSVGVPNELITAGNYLLKQDITEKSSFEVIDANKFSGGSTCYDASCAIPLARANGADRAVTGVMISIGNKIIVESTVFDVHIGTPMLYNSLNSQTPSDLDAVINRLADSIVQNRPVAEVATINNITEQENQSPRRTGVAAFMGLDFGPEVPVGNSYFGAGTLVNFEPLLFSFEVGDHAMLQFKPLLNFSWNNGNSNPSILDWKPLEIGGYYIFGVSDIAPYVGGSVDLHVFSGNVTINGNSQSINYTDFGMSVGGGVLFFRTSRTRLFVQVNYAPIFDSFGGNGAQSINFNIGFMFHI